MLTRRHFIVTSAALFSQPIAAQTPSDPAAIAEDVLTPQVAPPPRAPVSPASMWPVWDRQVVPADYHAPTTNPWGFHPRFLPQLVFANPGLRPGDIYVDAVARYLYHIGNDGTAMRYGVAIARGNLYEPGTYTVRRMAKWPTWRPTPAMIAREPQTYGPFAGGMDGGPANPLGARAIYLFDAAGRDTYLRIHGTPQPRSIGGRASSGCVRMVMAHIIDLYENVQNGSQVVLYPPEGVVTAAS